jgi:hypothetical protein
LPASALPERTLSMRGRWAAEGLGVLYMSGVALCAVATGNPYFLFPELAALSHDVFTRPWGRWARQPILLIVTPALTAIVGTLATRLFPYHVLTILGVVIVSIAIIQALGSAIAPAISAGVLPLALGAESLLYPPSVLAVVIALSVLSTLWRARCDRRGPASTAVAWPDVDDVLESRPRGRAWLVALLAFVAVTGTAAQLTGLRFLLFPPLIVIAYEMFGHPESCPWAVRPLWLPIACTATAFGGFVAVTELGTGPFAVAAALVWGVLALRVFRIHMPPALAVGLIPFVMDEPTFLYPLSVGSGTLMLTIAFLLFQRVTPQLTRPDPIDGA